MWFLPLRYSNICSMIIAFSYLLSTLPYPHGVPTVPGLPHIWVMCLSVYSYLLPSPNTHTRDNTMISEIPGWCHYWDRKDVYLFIFFFIPVLQLHVNQFKQLCFQNRVNRNGTVIYGKQHNSIFNWKFNPMITACFFPSLSFWNPRVNICLVLDLQHQDDIWNKYLGR